MLGSAPALLEVDPLSPPSMEEPFLQDPDKEVVFDLASEFDSGDQECP